MSRRWLRPAAASIRRAASAEGSSFRATHLPRTRAWPPSGPADRVGSRLTHPSRDQCLGLLSRKTAGTKPPNLVRISLQVSLHATPASLVCRVSSAVNRVGPSDGPLVTTGHIRAARAGPQCLVPRPGWERPRAPPGVVVGSTSRQISARRRALDAHGHERSDAPRDRHRLVAAAALVRPGSVGPAARGTTTRSSAGKGSSTRSSNTRTRATGCSTSCPGRS